MSKRQQAGDTKDQVVTDGEDAPDHDQRHEVQVPPILHDDRCQAQQQHQYEDAFHAWRPFTLNKPSGLKISVTISSA